MVRMAEPGGGEREGLTSSLWIVIWDAVAMAKYIQLGGDNFKAFENGVLGVRSRYLISVNCPSYDHSLCVLGPAASTILTRW